ncbi:Uncharacterized protein FWK35_00014630 [Aphis craccivora]|uniref:Uncharacterized protein n=1 Tax=Aphis craccivora TaxID=307492 RepID=A0A6G0Y9U4_APHCR|nr:Uncharacterized protein FWK35_00014630 [Aphis craccivora]
MKRNIGNFKEACVLFSKHMPKFSELFSKDTNYTSICANSVKDSIIEEVGPEIFIAIKHKGEQMSFKDLLDLLTVLRNRMLKL